MKNILITGAGSFIGTSFEKYLAQWPEQYRVDTLDMVDGSWREKSFAGYDAVFHVAGIAHSDSGELTDEKKELYHRVNTDLAIETAKKAKQDGAKQFIFMSSAIVYGDSAPLGEEKIITRDTPVAPANYYGSTKVWAEEGILPLSSEVFHVVVLRPPMIYGPGCKGNYVTLSKLARKLPLFPKAHNQRSMLYIGNLVEFVRLMVENREQGIFWPQNGEYTQTARMAELIAQAHGRKLITVPGTAWALKFMGKVTSLVDKAFGNLSYDQSMSDYSENYRICTLEESIRETEGEV